jgi:urease subunit gamma/beta
MGSAAGARTAIVTRSTAREVRESRPVPCSREPESSATSRYDAIVRLTAWEEERLLIFGAAELARRHRAAGILLNAPEATAIMCDAMLEAARAGRSYADVEAAGLAAVAPDEVIDGVRELVEEVRLEVLVGDGTRLIVLDDPLGRGRPRADDGPGAIVPSRRPSGPPADTRERRRIIVRSDSRRSIRVSSHHPFDRVNARIVFNRPSTTGFHLDLAAGAFETWAPGETREVELVRYGGIGGDRGDASEHGG